MLRVIIDCNMFLQLKKTDYGKNLLYLLQTEGYVVHHVKTAARREGRDKVSLKLP